LAVLSALNVRRHLTYSEKVDPAPGDMGAVREHHPINYRGKFYDEAGNVIEAHEHTGDFKES
jgi:hypothetical protein